MYDQLVKGVNYFLCVIKLACYTSLTLHCYVCKIAVTYGCNNEQSLANVTLKIQVFQDLPL